MNKIKGKDKSRGKNTVLKYREGNVVDFDINHIIRIANIYHFDIKQINEGTVQIINNKRKSTWFLFNRNTYLELRHKNQGSDNIHSHHQKDFYDVDFCMRSIATHECFKDNNLDYRNSGIGRMFNLIEQGKSKYVKIS